MPEAAVHIHEGQWLRSGEALFADCDGEDCLVVLDSEVANHPMIDQMAESPRLSSARKALEQANAAATRAKDRGSVDGFQRIVVFMRDLVPDR
jgi:hypothetical protein